MRDLFIIRNKIDKERRRRIMLSVWAYAYEFENKSLVSDAVFDSEAELVDTTVATGRLDDWWKENFKAHTGIWVHNHPELDKVGALYQRFFNTPLACASDVQ